MLQLKQMINTLNSKITKLMVTQQIVYTMTELSVCHQHCSQGSLQKPLEQGCVVT